VDSCRSVYGPVADSRWRDIVKAVKKEEEEKKMERKKEEEKKTKKKKAGSP
jgi:hypothetical protein